MNSVGMDVSKEKSMIVVMRPFGKMVISPFEAQHTDSEMSELVKTLKSLDGETRVVMEATGNYHTPVAHLLHDAGFYVSVVNAMLVHDYGNNSLRQAKTDKKCAVKLANYGLDRWLSLPRYAPEDETRLMLKNCYRQYRQYSKIQTVLKNNLISLINVTFSGVNRLFSSPVRPECSKPLLLLRALMLHRTNPGKWMSGAEALPSAGHLPCVERAFLSWVSICRAFLLTNPFISLSVYG